MKYLKVFEDFNIDPHENIIMDDIEDVKQLAKKMGVTITKQLGKGSYGIAFATTDGKVLKLTTDEWEVSTARKIGSDNEYLVNYYQVEPVEVSDSMYAKNWTEYYWDETDRYDVADDMDLYALLMNEIKPITDETIKTICSWMSIRLKFNVKYKEYLYDDELVSSATLQFFQIDTNDENMEKLRWVVDNFKNIFKELEENGIEQVDMNVGNVGMSNDHLCLFDISGRFRSR